ncbi:MAG: EutN/CcmL family microcompartment protein [Planctomycetes bacterium]|nr:EutN/CcmL family microcompartment protein [Planctomycetota bacterium]
MYLARVTGRLVATVISPGLAGVRLQWIQPIDEKGEPMGSQQVACSAIDSGPGDLVEFVDGREAAVALPGETFVPVDATIVGYVSQAVCGDLDLAKENA